MVLDAMQEELQQIKKTKKQNNLVYNEQHVDVGDLDKTRNNTGMVTEIT